jgi:hypothetical protein
MLPNISPIQLKVYEQAQFWNSIDAASAEGASSYKNHYHITLNENILLGVMKMEYQSTKNAAPFVQRRE